MGNGPSAITLSRAMSSMRCCGFFGRACFGLQTPLRVLTGICTESLDERSAGPPQGGLAPAWRDSAQREGCIVMISSNLPGYAELHCVTNFSFLRGASHGEELVERAAALGYAALAITDECSVAGVVRAHVEAKEHGVHLIIGSEINLLTAGGEPYARLVLLATDRAAYGNLSELITLARTRAEKGSYRAYASDLEGKAPGHPHLQNLPGCLALL